MTLLLLRHAESEGNATGRIQGWADFGLTELGHRQAEAAAGHLAGAGAGALYSSPLRRARDTALIVAEHTGLEVVDLPDLREYRFGEAQGMSWSEAQERFGVEGRDWGAGGIPGEEGTPAFRDRVQRQIEELAERHASDVAIVVLHGGVIGALVSRLMGLADSAYAQIYSTNCGVTTLSQGMDGRTAVVGLNDVCHLRELGEIAKEPWLVHE